MQISPITSMATTPMIDLDDSHVVLLDQGSPCRVLIVDDDELVLRRLSVLLQRDGYDTHAATTAEAALQILEGTPCQIVLTDWHMPDMDGLALCRKLRSRQNTGYIYILLLTVRNGHSDIVAGLAAGADDYVVKGATAEEILARIGVGRRITHLEGSLRASDQENRRISVTDALTGVRNRRFLMKYLPRELDRARQSARPLSVLSCDIDHFKRVNDNFGHATGDEVLQEFARRAASCIRKETDWIVRSGGEEFVLVLPETSRDQASRVAERLRQELAADTIPTSSGRLSITVSTGVCALETEQELSEASVLDLLSAADRGLYASKKLGRDRATTMAVSCASPEADPRPRDTRGPG
jgi:two-component system, cell cycle response regulator